MYCTLVYSIVMNIDHYLNASSAFLCQTTTAYVCARQHVNVLTPERPERPEALTRIDHVSHYLPPLCNHC